MSSLLRSVQIFPDLKGAHDPDLSYKKFDEVQHRTSIYVAAEDIPAGTEITDPRWVIKLDNSAAYDAEQDRKEAEALRVAADAARMGFVPKGPYNPANENKYGEWYTHEGGSYGYIWPEPSTGVPLSDTTHWQQIASQGLKGDAFEYEDFTPEQLAGLVGNGIKSILRTSGDGTPGTTDTYTITFDDDSTTTFPVYNGADGDISNIKVDGATKTKTAGVVDLTSDFARYALWRKTASGNPVSAYPVPESPLYPKVSGTFTQAGTGDPSPSNIRPITPWLANGASVSVVQIDGATITLTAPQEIPAGWMDNEGKGQVTWLEKVFDGTEDFSRHNTNNAGNARLFHFLFVAGQLIGNIKCSHYQTGDSMDVWENGPSGSILLPTDYVVFVHPNPDISLEDFKAYLAAQYAAGTPVTIYYQLATPIPITPAIAPLTALPQLDRITPRQNVLTASTGDIELTYAKSPIRESDDIATAIAAL